MIEVLNWIVSDWFHTAVFLIIILLLSNFRLICIEVNNGSTYIEKVDADETEN